MQCKDNFANSVQTPVLLSWRIKSVWKFAISESGNTEAPTLKSTGWQTNPDTNNSKNTWHWLTGKWFKERGDMLLLWKSGKSEKTRKNCFVWHLQLSKINFSGVTQGPGKCDMKFYAIPRCVFVIQWEIFKRVFDQWKERLVLSLSEIRMVTFF